MFLRMRYDISALLAFALIILFSQEALAVSSKPKG
jgi:hypothetical protein